MGTVRPEGDRAGAAAILDRLFKKFGADLDPKVMERMDLLFYF